MRRPVHPLLRAPKRGADCQLRINAASLQQAGVSALPHEWSPTAWTYRGLHFEEQAIGRRSHPTWRRGHRDPPFGAKQLFNAIDPAPFCEKDLDPKAEEFIVDWARELPANAPLTLVVLLDRPAGLPDEAQVLRDAVGQYFGMRSQASRQRLKRLFKIGRTSLLIGLLFLAVSFALGEIIESAFGGQRIGELLRESFIIGGWVAMWRPLEIFLYDWWPLRSERTLYDRLSAMPVRVHYADSEASS